MNFSSFYSYNHKLPPFLKFKTELVGAHHGQKDITITALVQGEYGGRVDFTEFQGEVSINWIEVPQKYRRYGIGSRLVQEITKETNVPYKDIQWNYTTDDGTQLKTHLDKSPRDIKYLTHLMPIVQPPFKESVSALFKIPSTIAKNYKVTDTLTNVDTWKAKILLGNSMSRGKKVGDWDDVGYVGFSTKDNTIIPISRSDEHQNGYELLDMLVRKKLIPHEQYVTVYNGNNFLWPNETEWKLHQQAFKRWMLFGGKNRSVQVDVNGSIFKGYMEDIIKIKSVKDLKTVSNQKETLAPHGKQIINDLESIAHMVVHVNKTEDPDDVEKLNRGALNFLDEHMSDLIKCKIQIIDIEKDITKKYTDYKNTEQIFFGMNGIKNKIHIMVRKMIKVEKLGKNSADDFDWMTLGDIKSIFGNFELANNELNQLGNI